MRSTDFIILLFVALSAPCPGHAQTQPDKPAPSSDYSKEAFLFEHFQARVTLEADGKNTRELTGELKMLADAGVKAFAVLNFTYGTANEVVEVDYVRVRKPDGTVVDTPDYNIQDMPADITRAAPMYSDIHEKHIAVKGLGVGDVLQYHVRFRTVKPEIPGHFWFEYSFTKDHIIKDERLEFSFPKEKFVNVVSPEFKPDIKDDGARRFYRWTSTNLERKEKNSDEVQIQKPLKPSVQITTFRSWEEVGHWFGDLQKEPLKVTPVIQAKAAELTKSLHSDDAKIRAIYNYVSFRFHYIGLDFGIGRYQPHAAEDVLGNEYGDCKDKHTLLAALLKAAGYDAWPALIHTSRKVDPDVPSPAQFNHLITVISRGSELIWADTTAEVAPLGMLLQPLRDKQALVIRAGKPPVLLATPLNPPFAQDQRFFMDGKLQSDGTFKGHAELTYRGDLEVFLRGAFRQVPPAQWQELAQQWSVRLNFGGQVSNVQATPPEETDKPFHISYDYVREKYGDWENKRITLPLPPIGVEAADDKDEKKPSEPLFLGAPGEILFRAKIELPPGYAISPPKDLDLVEPYAEYHATSVLQDRMLTTSRLFTIKKHEVTPVEWDRYRKFGKAIGDDEFTFIALKNGNDDTSGDAAKVDELDRKAREGANALKRGDISRAQELLEQVIAVDPNYETAHFNLGLILEAQNKTEQAIVEFRKEEEIDPDDPHAYQMAAPLLLFKGRKDEALQEWRKLLAIDPKNHDAALAASHLLSNDHKYDEAAALLESAVNASPDSPSLELALGSAYLKGGHADKGVPLLRKAIEREGTSVKTDPDVLNNVAYELAESKSDVKLAHDYAEKAVIELENRSLNTLGSDDMATQVTYQLSFVWDTLGWVYFQMGDAARAESYVRASWLLGQHAVVGDHLGQIYEKLGKTKDAAHAYELALAASSTPVVRTADSLRFDEPRQETHDAILARYEKLTGKKPNTSIHRLPNGEWSLSPAEELSRARRVDFPDAKLAGDAIFLVVFAPGKVESARYTSGDESLKAFADKLITAKFQVAFPNGSSARIARRVTVFCHSPRGCAAVMLPANSPRPQQY